MSDRSTQILHEALALSPQERAKLVEDILASFNLSPSQEIDQLWADEAENRLNAYQQKQINSVPAKEVFQNIAKRKN